MRITSVRMRSSPLLKTRKIKGRRPMTALIRISAPAGMRIFLIIEAQFKSAGDLAMKKNKLDNKTDIKIFILFLLDNVNTRLDDVTLSEIVMENGAIDPFGFQECLSELVEIGHVFEDSEDGKKYYGISERGHLVIAELYDEIDEELRKKSLSCAARLITLRRSGISVRSSVEEKGNRYYGVNVALSDKHGDIISISLTVSSKGRAEEIKAHFDGNPQLVYRGVMSALTGEIDFLL